MPVFQLWAPLFFFMLLCLGLDSQFANVDVTITFIKDQFGPQVLRFLKREELLTLIMCIIGFLLGIPHVTKGGIYVFQLMDHCTIVSIVVLAFFEVVAVCWIFGVPRLSFMVKRMRGKNPNIYFRVCWLLFSPLLVLCILISSIVQYTPVHYGKYSYPGWAQAVGWCFSLVFIVWIPLGAIQEIIRHKGSLLQRLKTAIIPTIDLNADDSLPEKRNQENPALENMLPLLE